MKRRDLIKRLEAVGFKLARSGGSHDVYQKEGGETEIIPRHKEIKEPLANAILKRWGA